MSSKKVLHSYQCITDGDMADATITSAATDVSCLDNISVQFTCTGSPTGTFAILGSVDGTSYAGLTTEPTSLAASGSAVTVIGTVKMTGIMKIKAKYTKTSGTGTLQAYISGKSI
jgi:hypothetical protein